MNLDLNPLVSSAQAIVANHALGDGAFRRWNRDNGSGRDIGINPYGCADAANILYTIGQFPRDRADRVGWVAALQSLQNPETGLFEESTHHAIHTTAHCIAALELFDARPLHRLAGLDEYKSIAALHQFLDSLNWRGNPWRESHRGAGLFAALAIVEEVGPDWMQAYFDWLWEHTDPRTGMLGGADIAPVTVGGIDSMVPPMAGTFHYFFNSEWAKQPKRYPERMIDSCIDMLDNDQFPLGQRIGFAEIDWVYCVNRSLRQSGHRFADCQAALKRLGTRLFDYVMALDPDSDDGLNDLHALFGMLCAFAELQQAVPGFIRTDRPLKLVLDRRPFI